MASVGVLAACATPVALVSSGGAPIGPAARVEPGSPGRRRARNWIYANDFYDATHFIYKRAGSDGCLQGATSCPFGSPGDANNLPQNYNGTQEFNKWWADLGTSSTAQPNGVLGKWVSKRDHLFPDSTFQINVQELTIPGATCPGQQVMLAYHPDSQGVTAPSPGTSATPYSSMYSGDWGTGSPYDSNMGALMNLEEIGSVLRWHEANGTYPVRTIKSAVYDAELQGLRRLIGSLLLHWWRSHNPYCSGPASIGSTKVLRCMTTAAALCNAAQSQTGIFGVGQAVAIDDANTENNLVQTVGTAGEDGHHTVRRPRLRRRHQHQGHQRDQHDRG